MTFEEFEGVARYTKQYCANRRFSVDFRLSDEGLMVVGNEVVDRNWTTDVVEKESILIPFKELSKAAILKAVHTVVGA